MTRVHDMIELTHMVVVTYADTATGVVFRAECSCGWSGDSHDDTALAELDGDDHHGVAVAPADDLDRAISGMLDLQDDLARAVMWLAEHWSADLPVPASRGVGLDAARVELAAYCDTAEVLARAAAVLGAPLVDDTTPDSYGARYQRAVRTFGRVRLEVYRALDPDCGVAA
jgi:hypothetical protein